MSSINNYVSLPCPILLLNKANILFVLSKLVSGIEERLGQYECVLNRPAHGHHAQVGDCQDNTAGYNCEECKPGYERDAYQQCVPSRTVPSSCKIGTFGLDQENPDGCTPCYCSGVTRDCVETPNYSRIAIPAPIIGENYGNYSITDLTARQIINDQFSPSASESELTYIFNFLPNEELFWSLPQFTGWQRIHNPPVFRAPEMEVLTTSRDTFTQLSSAFSRKGLVPPQFSNTGKPERFHVSLEKFEEF
ncbi:hypothetical protein MSG28_000801 [Choristoneura fumiferana]|uniref:Uncharacterized protein n=1 Tax=Choristoneura fumiferana TaxID=7141 RepID=A0ACC0K2A8_CHOFU|nr:hypothetical protein MSG28_000801 [Choristoneura fumiferana]